LGRRRVGWLVVRRSKALARRTAAPRNLWDPNFAEKMADVLSVYREVKVLKEAAAAAKKANDAVAIISYDEKPGSRPSPRRHPTCRPCPACMRLSRVSLSTSATARLACWPASIC
jgi:hypothetical protein